MNSYNKWKDVICDKNNTVTFNLLREKKITYTLAAEKLGINRKTLLRHRNEFPIYPSNIRMSNEQKLNLFQQTITRIETQKHKVTDPTPTTTYVPPSEHLVRSSSNDTFSVVSARGCSSKPCSLNGSLLTEILDSTFLLNKYLKKSLLPLLQKNGSYYLYSKRSFSQSGKFMLRCEQCVSLKRHGPISKISFGGEKVQVIESRHRCRKKLKNLTWQNLGSITKGTKSSADQSFLFVSRQVYVSL